MGKKASEVIILGWGGTGSVVKGSRLRSGGCPPGLMHLPGRIRVSARGAASIHGTGGFSCGRPFSRTKCEKAPFSLFGRAGDVHQAAGDPAPDSQVT